MCSIDNKFQSATREQKKQSCRCGLNFLGVRNQAIIRYFKFHYRKTIVQQIIKDIDSHNSSDSLAANKLSKSLSILDSMHTIRNIWDIVPSITISNFYKKCGLNIADEADDLTEEMIINE
ncbi:hypothetical protein AVEN_203594-1 [Araneus ventricosus]|uniref:DDE-1 domain-containing protein n=1 Tax=Araneus ventricosus TaxID=182803 RepID=A0A4Y2JXW6_ARAVE|nr:hypothetical protein AVEN_203594-1 [Araneus ventricosus]